MRRRVYLSSLLAGVVGTAGCLGDSSSDQPASGSPTGATSPDAGTDSTPTTHTATVDGGNRVRYTLTMSEPPSEFDEDSPQLSSSTKMEHESVFPEECGTGRVPVMKSLYRTSR